MHQAQRYVRRKHSAPCTGVALVPRQISQVVTTLSIISSTEDTFELPPQTVPSHPRVICLVFEVLCPLSLLTLLSAHGVILWVLQPEVWTCLPCRGRPSLARMIVISSDEERTIVHRIVWREQRDLLQQTRVEGGRRLKGPYHINGRLRCGTCGRFPTWLGCSRLRRFDRGRNFGILSTLMT